MMNKEDCARFLIHHSAFIVHHLCSLLFKFALSLCLQLLALAL